LKTSSIIVIAIFLLVYIAPLGVRFLIMPDETRYAEIPREMLASGDWVVPRLDGLRYFEKPVLGYWLSAAAIRLCGENAFAVRLPSALATGLTAWCLFLLVRKHTGRHDAGLLTAVVFLGCAGVFLVGTFNVLDSIFSLFLTATLVAYYFAWAAEGAGKRRGLLALAGGFCSLAFLTKGFLALVIPVVVLTPFLLWQRRRQGLPGLIVIPLLAALAVALPWSILIHLREPGFWRYFFWTEHIERFTRGESQHPQPFWYFIPVFLGSALPWTGLLPTIIKRLRDEGLRDPLIRFCLCWFTFVFLFFSASRGKLATYILPGFGAWAVLVAWGLGDGRESGVQKNLAGAAWAGAITGGVLAVVLAVNQITGFPIARLYYPGELAEFTLLATALVALSILSVAAVRAREARQKLIFCSAPLLLMFSAAFIMPDRFEEGKAPEEFLLTHASRVRPDDILVADHNMVHAVCWYYRRSDVYLLAPGELAYGLNYADARHRLLSLSQLNDLIKNAGGRHVLIVARDKRYANYEGKIPEPIYKDARQEFVFAEFSSGRP
jgi:4-amino-4-deoxy-L-arabinose transferase